MTAPATGAPQFASLYVGDLHPDCTEAMLYDIFNSVGPVASIRVCRDSVSRRSLGYAYVNFHSVSDAERSLDTLNYSSIKGRSCRIMWSHRDPSLRKSQVGNIFVKNLDKNIDNKALHDTFSLFGNILSCKVASDPNGASRGYGFVHYETAEAAKQAIERVNGMQIGESTVHVDFLKKRETKAEGGKDAAYTNLYIKHFPQSYDEDALKELFKDYGEIASSVIMSDGKGRKFAFVDLKESEMAAKAVGELHRKDMRPEEERSGDIPEDEHPEYLLYCQRAQSKAERAAELGAQSNSTQGVNLYIKNLGDDMTDEKLKELFAPFGETKSVTVKMDDDGKCKGFGFVNFESQDSATKAVTEMHLKVVSGKPLYVGLAEKRDARLGRLQQRYSPSGKGFGDSKGGKGKGGSKGYGKGGGGGWGGGGYGGGQGMPGYGQPGMMGGMMPGMMGGMPGMPAQRPMMGMPPMGYNPMMMGGMMRPPMPGMMGMPGKGGPMPMMGMQQRPQMMPQQQMMMQQQMMAQQQRPPQPQQPDPNAPLSAAALAAAPPAMQKQMLGGKIYSQVQKIQPELAGKITGMMLEMDNSELLILLESEVQLKNKVTEAMRVLEGMK
eukprot:gnl/MRDRNA2_/MRDRNA2_61423_c0_seq1.p1 gnl/MRDRNA2_/MRDRNA2_61423_c0~~gnl/MRDRNA2_/MRDRNA2_61423_c0_seq1.p1  ORF type:complete len:608 (+),score=166.58 gnl/MRDRNA2_/MRDRNA2_61423_c0_seq1:142-1965(+)